MPVCFNGTQAQKEWRMCYMKRRYETHKEASKDRGCRVYKCPVCKKFHRTHENVKNVK